MTIGETEAAISLRQYRIILVREMRSPIFRQMKQKFEGILCVLPMIFVKYDGASGKQIACYGLCGVALKVSFK